MKLLIAGTRKLNIMHVDVAAALKEFQLEPTEIVSGGAQGPDQAAQIYGVRAELPTTIFYPGWEFHGKKAGILRNIEMGKYADQLLAFWDSKSRGTKHMIDYMVELQKPCTVIYK